MNKQLTFLDLFSGIGGFKIALERVGFKSIGFCDNDEYANKLYRAYFKNDKELFYDDIRKINTSELPDFDILCAGFPCQSFSIAGKRRGFEDTRGTMFFEVARILKDKRPKYFILENVKGLLNHVGGTTFQTILKVLSDIGYSVQWQLLNSKFFGVPQNRERVYIVGCYGKECTGEHENAEVFFGRMDQKQMTEMIKEKQIDLVIDATHPFAQLVTGEIRRACEISGVQYLRCLREKMEAVPDEADRVIWAQSDEDAVEYLQNTEGKILITTGSKELIKYTKLTEYKERCFARVLSTEQAVMESVALGFEGKHLIAMQGPFSKEMNVATIHQTGAKYFVTKESGKAGGFGEKVQAAKETGAVLVAVGRPKETGRTFSEVCKWLEKNL